MSSESYPEHAKLEKISKKSQAIGDFLVWLETGGLEDEGYDCVELAYWDQETASYQPLNWSPTRLTATFFEIDTVALDKEKERILEELRAVDVGG